MNFVVVVGIAVGDNVDMFTKQLLSYLGYFFGLYMGVLVIHISRSLHDGKLQSEIVSESLKVVGFGSSVTLLHLL